jgi:hypothetical protein
LELPKRRVGGTNSSDVDLISGSSRNVSPHGSNRIINQLVERANGGNPMMMMKSSSKNIITGNNTTKFNLLLPPSAVHVASSSTSVNNNNNSENVKISKQQQKINASNKDNVKRPSASPAFAGASSMNSQASSSTDDLFNPKPIPVTILRVQNDSTASNNCDFQDLVSPRDENHQHHQQLLFPNAKSKGQILRSVAGGKTSLRAGVKHHRQSQNNNVTKKVQGKLMTDRHQHARDDDVVDADRAKLVDEGTLQDDYYNGEENFFENSAEGDDDDINNNNNRERFEVLDEFEEAPVWEAAAYIAEAQREQCGGLIDNDNNNNNNNGDLRLNRYESTQKPAALDRLLQVILERDERTTSDLIAYNNGNCQYSHRNERKFKGAPGTSPYHNRSPSSSQKQRRNQQENPSRPSSQVIAGEQKRQRARGTPPHHSSNTLRQQHQQLLPHVLISNASTSKQSTTSTNATVNNNNNSGAPPIGRSLLTSMNPSSAPPQDNGVTQTREQNLQIQPPASQSRIPVSSSSFNSLGSGLTPGVVVVGESQ